LTCVLRFAKNGFKEIEPVDVCQVCQTNPVEFKAWPICRTCKQSIKLDGKPYPKWDVDGRKHIAERYGDELCRDLESLRVNPGVTLKTVGDKHGWSREYSRQLYKQYFGTPYTKAVKVKSDTYKSDMACAYDPRRKVADYAEGLVLRGAIAELKFFHICKSIGYDIRPNDKKVVDFIVNGFLVEVKSCGKPRKTTSYGPYYYRAKLGKKQLELSDFLAFYINERDFFIILPRSFLKSTMTYFNRDMIGDYHQFISAWHLLKNPDLANGLSLPKKNKYPKNRTRKLTAGQTMALTLLASEDRWRKPKDIFGNADSDNSLILNALIKRGLAEKVPMNTGSNRFIYRATSSGLMECQK
jgi:hypothetical protein